MLYQEERKTNQTIKEIADYVRDMKSPHDPDITLDQGTNRLSNLEAPTSAIDTLEKQWSISIVSKVNSSDLQKAEPSELEIVVPLIATIQPLLIEEKSLLNRETLVTVTHADKNHFVHHINTEDENVLEFLEDFNFSTQMECTEAEIDEFLEGTKSCDVNLHPEVVDVALLA